MNGTTLTTVGRQLLRRANRYTLWAFNPQPELTSRYDRRLTETAATHGWPGRGVTAAAGPDCRGASDPGNDGSSHPRPPAAPR